MRKIFLVLITCFTFLSGVPMVIACDEESDPGCSDGAGEIEVHQFAPDKDYDASTLSEATPSNEEDPAEEVLIETPTIEPTPPENLPDPGDDPCQEAQDQVKQIREAIEEFKEINNWAMSSNRCPHFNDEELAEMYWMLAKDPEFADKNPCMFIELGWYKNQLDDLHGQLITAMRAVIRECGTIQH